MMQLALITHTCPACPRLSRRDPAHLLAVGPDELLSRAIHYIETSDDG